MCRSMVDIQSYTAEIRLGIKKDRCKSQGKNIMSASATQGGHNESKVGKISDGTVHEYGGGNDTVPLPVEVCAPQNAVALVGWLSSSLC